MSNTRNENLGYLFGLIAVAAFAVTLPATRAAVRALDPVFVGFGRAVGAALLGAVFLLLTRQRLPSREEAKGLVIVAAGVVGGFPLFSAWAMRDFPGPWAGSRSSHGRLSFLPRFLLFLSSCSRRHLSTCLSSLGLGSFTS